MAKVETVQVYWPAKFGDELVWINASDFDAAIHKLPATGGPVTNPSQSKPQPTGRKHNRSD